MSTPYTYYRILPGSPAAEIVKTYIAARERQRKAAKKFGDLWLPTKDYHLVSNDAYIVGFAPKDLSWQNFRTALGEKAALWVEKEDKNIRWIRPRATVAGNPDSLKMNDEWSKIPVIEAWDSIAVKMFGMSRFMDGLTIYGMVASWNKKNNIVGVPWLAAQGALTDFNGRPDFKPMEGLKAIPIEEALHIMYDERIKKDKAAIAKKMKERVAYEKKRDKELKEMASKTAADLRQKAMTAPKKP